MNQMDLFADEAAKLWASEVERETSTESLDLPVTSSSPEPRTSEYKPNDPEWTDLELPQDSVATSQELPTGEDQANQGAADADIPADIPSDDASDREFPEDVNQEQAADTAEDRIVLGDQPEEDGLREEMGLAEPDGGPPALPDIEFPEDQQGQYQDQPLPQDFRTEYRDSLGWQRADDGDWRNGPNNSQSIIRQPQQMELPSDFDERLRFAIQPELDQLQDALGSRTADIIAENAILASLSVVPE